MLYCLACSVNSAAQVALPYNALKSVDIKSSTNVFISKGFTAPALELAATSLGGAINADGLTVSNLILRANGYECSGLD